MILRPPSADAATTTQPGRFSRFWRYVRQIQARIESLTSLSDRDLTRFARSLGWRARSGIGTQELLIEGFAATAEALRRTHGICLYPVQLYAGLALQAGQIVEMQTGEGKTVTAVAPVFVRALAGRGCHVMTSNEYLAERDANHLRPAYELLGLTVSCVKAQLDTPERRAAYDCDVTYGTANEFGFDYLRDRLKSPELLQDHDDEEHESRGPGVQRGRFFAMVDEADSILLDEGRTPLIIALPTSAEASLVTLLKWAHQTAGLLAAGHDFVFKAENRSAQLTEQGCRRVLMHRRPADVCRYDLETIYRRVEVALQAQWAFQRDRDYLIKGSEVQIVDESTGRAMDGRRWQEGLHQAVEVKEQMEPTDDHAVGARITLQRYLSLYAHVAGMTGTAWPARREFRRLYKLHVQRVPTHRPCRRITWPPRVFATLAAKFDAVVREIVRLRDQGRAVLVGTPSIRASETLSERLTALQVPHRLLNARQDAEENEIVAEAGEPGRVTIATNMAGRGTDIHLHPSVREAGGLHVIATEFHTARRIDRQLVGRSARQGDPGTCQFLVSVEDELFQLVPEAWKKRWQAAARQEGQAELSARRWLGIFLKSQRRLERQHARDRRKLGKHERQRWKTYRQMGLDPCLDLAEDR
uniref:Protein translocase subunit SecA n=1 Tax=Schlesneria paludicola TaxID=360056 RepID=A0A7C2K1K6_9PLAN